MTARDPSERGAGAEEALARALVHARGALGEGLAVLHALLDAGTQAGGARLGPALRRLDEGLARLEQGEVPDLAAGLLAALEGEIRRWEDRGARDPDARAVLRAFLALREALWEAGLRPRGSPEAGAPSPAEPAAPPEPAPPRRRAQRVRVQG